MHYVLIDWVHDEIDEPAHIYSELDQDRREVRRVEFYTNGLCFSCGAERGNLDALRREPFPTDLRELCTEEGMTAHAITPMLFYEVWSQAQERPDGFMNMFF